MVLKSRFYSSLSWSNKRRADKMILLYNKYFNTDKTTVISQTRIEDSDEVTTAVNLKEDFVAETVLFNEPKYVIGYSVYVEKGMPKINVIERPPPEHGRGCKCDKCVITNIEEIEKIIKKRNKNEQTRK